MKRKFVLLGILVLLVGGCREENALVKDEVLKTVLKAEAWWNEGSVEGYMESYWKSPELRFASGGRVTLGWQPTLDRYLKRYPDRAAMGRLIFSDLDVRVLADDAALVFGAWKLVREKDEPQGLFTLLLRKFDDGWRIVHDHTSSAG